MVVTACYIILKMWYPFTSGLPQPADLLIVFAAPLVISAEDFSSAIRLNVWISFFAIWTILVNAAWFFNTGQINIIVTSTYYVFNAFIFYLFVAAALRHPIQFGKAINWAVIISALVQLAFVFLTGTRFRHAGSFQNPNQLAYWTVCGLSLYFLTKKTSSAIDIPVIALFLLLEAMSVSRAGLVAIGLLILIWGALSLRTNPRSLIVGGLAAVLGAAFLFATHTGRHYVDKMQFVENFEHRIDERRHVEEYHNRHYDRLANKVGYLAFGAGEGDYSRFQEAGRAIEIHSTLASILFCYGVIGLILFLVLIGSAALKAAWTSTVYIVPSIIYGLTHNGARFAYFWIVLAVIAASYGQRHRVRGYLRSFARWPARTYQPTQPARIDA